MKQQSQKEQHQEHIQELSSKQKQSEKTIVVSKYKSEYDDTLGPFCPQTADIKVLEMDLLKKGRIQIDRNYFEFKMQVEILQHSNNYEALLFRVTYGFFTMNISVLIVEGTSHCHNLPVIYINSLNKIFSFDDKNRKQSCIKCVQVNNNDEMASIFNSVLKEVYIQKIASLLKVGPAIPQLFGFDIVIYSSCIEFAMEKCQKVLTLNKEQVAILKQKLATMHIFGLIHNDIKPSNIMISSTSNEIIYIDFGLSTHINQQIGQKTRARFSGTLQYCSQEMLRAYESKQVESIDLYYNDLVCLTKLLQQLYSQEQNEGSAQSGHQNEDNPQVGWDNILYYQNYYQRVEMYFSFLNVKYKILSKQMIDLNIFDQLELRQQYFLKIFQFFQKLPKSNYILHFQDLLCKMQQKYKVDFVRVVKTRVIKLVKQQPQNDFAQQNDQEQCYTKIIRILYAGNKQNNQSFNYIRKGQKFRNWLSNFQKPKQTNRLNLIRSFCNFIDFRKTLSTFDQKVKAAKQLMSVINPSLLSSVKQQSDYLLMCLKYLLRDFTQFKQTYFQQVIPIAIRNLLILNELECTEVKQLVRQLLGESIDTLPKFKLKIRLQLILEWAQKYWYSPENKLTQVITQLYLTKMDQSFSSILRQLQKIILGQLSCTYSQIIQQVQKLFDKLYVGQQFIEELIIWQVCYVYIDIAFNQQHRYETIFLRKVSFISDYSKKYNYTFDFYYFNLNAFKNSFIRIQLTAEFYHRLQACLMQTKLMKHFFVYYEYQNYLMKKQPSLPVRQQYYLQVMRTLSPLFNQSKDSCKLNEEYLKKPFYMNLLTQVYAFSRNLLPAQIPELSAQLKRHFKPTILRKLCPMINLEDFVKQRGNKIRYNFMFFTLIAYLYSLLYNTEPFYIDELSLYCQHLQIQISQIECEDNSQMMRMVQIQNMVVDCLGKIYNIKKQHSKVIKEYRRYFKKYLLLNPELFIASSHFNSAFLTLINETSLHQQSRLLQTQKLYFETIFKHKIFGTLFGLQKGRVSLKYINSYLLITKNYPAFIQFHACLAVDLSRFIYLDQMKTYIQSLRDLKILGCLCAEQLWEKLDSSFGSYVVNQDTYFILLTSYVMSVTRQDQTLQIQPRTVNKWLCFISSKIDQAVYDAKIFALQNVYSYLLLSPAVKVQIIRNYVKYSEIVMKDSLFMKKMGHKLRKCRTESKGCLLGISVALKKWHVYATSHKLII